MQSPPHDRPQTPVQHSHNGCLCVWAWPGRRRNRSWSGSTAANWSARFPFWRKPDQRHYETSCRVTSATLVLRPPCVRSCISFPSRVLPQSKFLTSKVLAYQVPGVRRPSTFLHCYIAATRRRYMPSTAINVLTCYIGATRRRTPLGSPSPKQETRRLIWIHLHKSRPFQSLGVMSVPSQPNAVARRRTSLLRFVFHIGLSKCNGAMLFNNISSRSPLLEERAVVRILIINTLGSFCDSGLWGCKCVAVATSGFTVFVCVLRALRGSAP